MHIQFIVEQHGFELCVSVLYTGFFPIITNYSSTQFSVP